VFQHGDVEMLRLGRLERIHPSLHRFSDELLTRDISSVDELGKFYASKVRFAALLSYLLISFNSIRFFLPSFRVHKPAYSEPVCKPEIERCGWKGFWCKNALGYTVRLTLALVCVAAAGLLVVIQ